MDELSELKRQNEQFRKLFWLAAHDVIFFSNWNEKKQDWDDGFYPAINCNDFFYPAADAEGIPQDNLDHYLDLLIELAKRFDMPEGAYAWISLRRGQEPWKGYEAYDEEYRKNYFAAKEWLLQRGDWNV